GAPVDRAARAVMPDARQWLVPDLEAGLARAEAPIDLFVVGEVLLVEQADAQDGFPTEEQAGPHPHVDLPLDVETLSRQRVHAPPVDEPVAEEDLEVCDVQDFGVVESEDRARDRGGA